MSWRPIEAWLREHLPSGLERLAPPVDEEALRRFEGELGTDEGEFGVELPEAFRAAWREHDGEELGGSEYLFPMVQHLPLAAIASERDVMIAQLDEHYPGERNVAPAVGAVRAQYWNRRWIPFALLGGASDFYCLDLDPPEGGRVGQVIRASSKNYQRSVVAPDLTAYFDDLAAKLRDGRLAVVDGLIKPVTAPAAEVAASPVVSAGEKRRFGAGLAFAAVFWVAFYFAVTRQTPATVGAAMAAWVMWFAAKRYLARNGLTARG